MDIHEYQAKKILSGFGIEIPRGGIAYSPENAENKAREIGGSKWIVKAQIHSGARGKAGGIIVCNSALEVAQAADKLLGKKLVTKFQAREIAFGLGIDPKLISRTAEVIIGCYRAFSELDATMVEINPLIISKNDHILALDCKMSFDNNALFRRNQVSELRDKAQENSNEVSASVPVTFTFSMNPRPAVWSTRSRRISFISLL